MALGEAGRLYADHETEHYFLQDLAYLSCIENIYPLDGHSIVFDGQHHIAVAFRVQAVAKLVPSEN